MNTSASEKAIVYRRKSSEAEDRQVASLQQQSDELSEHVLKRESFSILKNLEESQSAKKPGRPKFNEMCEALEKGEGKYIVCWALNRLARNPVDGGRILWLVQNYGIKIVTPSKTYDINDVMLMHVEFAMSNQFIIDLRKNSNRGTEYKIKAGMAPILAPVGYKNETQKLQGQKDISIDEPRFSLVRKMWEYLLTGNYSVAHILRIATDDWGLRQKNGRPLSKTRVYKVFTDIFYTGKYIYAGEIHQGIHIPMVTMPEFDRAQKILGDKGRPRPQTHSFAYTGVMKCMCGCGITAHERYRKICPQCHHKYNAVTNDTCPKCDTPAPEKTWYTCVYHCTNKKNEKTRCPQPCIKQSDLEPQFDEILSRLIIDEEFIHWGLDTLREENSHESDERLLVVDSITKALGLVERKEKVLKEKFFSPNNEKGILLSEEDYLRMRKDISDERQRLQGQLGTETDCHEDWLTNFEKTFNYVKHAKYWLTHGTLEDKHAIAAGLGLNPTLENKKVRIHLREEFRVLELGRQVAEELKDWLEPEKMSYTSIQNAYRSGQFPLLGA